MRFLFLCGCFFYVLVGVHPVMDGSAWNNPVTRVANHLAIVGSLFLRVFATNNMCFSVKDVYNIVISGFMHSKGRILRVSNWLLTFLAACTVVCLPSVWFAHDRIDPPRVDMAHINQEAIEELFLFFLSRCLAWNSHWIGKDPAEGSKFWGSFLRLIHVIVHPERKHE